MFVQPVYANCPICIITVSGGLFIAKKLGIDDLLISIWIGGLNTAIAFWIASGIKKKILNNPYLWTILFYIFAIVYLLITKQIGHPKNTFLGIDKIFFGMTVGLLVFVFSAFIDKLIRKKNNNKVLFYYQKVIIPFLFLFVTTILFKIILGK